MAIFDIALAEAWAMRPDALENLLAIADRANEVTPEALEAYRAEYAKNGERYRIREDVAIIDMAGPLFKKANLFQAMSGASSYAVMARDFQAALDNDKVSGILLNMDTPGGTVNGCDELATAIFSARGKKPIVAYVSGQACSAGYWLATAADRVILSEASEVGSIGVLLGIVDTKDAEAKSGKRTIEFVSSKAPNKRPDYDTDEGRAVYQRRADNLGELFISTIAKHRGISAETVTKDFGAGGVEIGANAVKLGMADEVGTFETAFAQLTQRGKSRRSTKPKGASSMANEPGATGDEPIFTQAQVDKAIADGVAAHQARVTAITTSEEGKANPALAAHFANSTKLTAEEAIASLKAAGPAAKEKTAEEKAAEFKKAKTEGDGLSFAEEAGDKSAAKAGWATAVASANGGSL